MNIKEIEAQEAELQQQTDEIIKELRATPVAYSVTAETSGLFSLRQILAQLIERDLVAEWQLARIEQNHRVVILKRTADGWDEVAQCRIDAPRWSEGKGWND